jgi:hypothetical protein
MLEEAQHTKALLGLDWKEFALFLSLETPRGLSGKYLGNESLRGLGIGPILFTIRHPFKSPLDPLNFSVQGSISTHESLACQNPH